MTANQREIVEGPSREELFDALRLRNEGRKVSLTISRQTKPGSPFKLLDETFDVFVNGISVEDASGHKWLLRPL